MPKTSAERSYLWMYKSGMSSTGATEIWAVCTLPGQLLGEIKWMPRWRQYAYFAHKNTWLSPSCMADISEKVFELNKKRKDAIRARRKG